MSRTDAIDFLVAASDAEYAIITETARLVRERRTEPPPAKRGRPKGSANRKAKVNGADAAARIGLCEKHGTPMAMYATGPKCNKCAQEGA